MTEQSCLTWANHGKNIISHLHNIWHKELFIDSTIVCNGKYFPTHRFVLSSCSSYFEGILAKVPCQHPFLIMNDVDSKDLEALLDFMYQGKTTVVTDRLLPLLKAAKALRIKGLETFSEPASVCGSPSSETEYQEEKKTPLELPSPPNQEIGRTDFTTNSLIDHCPGFEQEMKVEIEECEIGNDSPPSPASLRLGQFPVREEYTKGGHIPRCVPSIPSYTPFTYREDISSEREPNTTTNHQGRSASQEVSLYQFQEEIKGRSLRRRKPKGIPFTFDRNKKAFNCPLCSYGTKYRGDLRKHLRTHTGEKPFACGKCPFMTSDSSSLKNHMRSHNVEKPFRCEECSFSTTNQATLKKHLKIHSTPIQPKCPSSSEDINLLENLGLFKQGNEKTIEEEGVL